VKKKIAVTLIIIILVFITGCGTKSPTNVKKTKVAATIFPIFDFVRNIGGDYIEPLLIVKPGESPHTFSPTVRDIKILQGVKIIFANNFGLDEWVTKIGENINGVKIINVNKNLGGVINTHNGNPHIWLSPNYAEEECKVIRDNLIELDPAHRDAYQKNYNVYIDKLSAEAQALKIKLNVVKNKKFVAFHPAYTYFAEYFNIKEVAVIEKMPGKEPSPGDLYEIEKAIKTNNIKALFKEPQLTPDILQAIADDTGTSIYTLDPLGGVKGRDSYIKLIQYNVNTILEVLGNG